MEVVWRAVAIYFFLWFITRVIGKRELGQMSAFELVLLVTMGDLIQQGVTQEDYSVTGAMLAVGRERNEGRRGARRPRKAQRHHIHARVGQEVAEAVVPNLAHGSARHAQPREADRDVRGHPAGRQFHPETP